MKKVRITISDIRFLIYPVFLLFLFFLLVINCAPPPSYIPKEVSPPKFSFDPPSTRAKKTNIIIAVVAPKYNADAIEKAAMVITQDNLNRMFEYTNYFTSAVASDTEKIIIARGFNSKGPFRSLDYMTYPDKKGSDLTLSPMIYITTSYSTSGKGTIFSSSPPGKLTVTGFMELIMLEPLSGEEMWLKKIDFDQVVADYNFSYWTTEKGVRNVTIDTRPEALKDALEMIYPKVLRTVWNYLNPEEVNYLKRESQEIRDRKRF